MWQANYVKTILENSHKELKVELKIIQTTGDRILDVPLAKIGGKGLFTKEIEVEMLNGTIDLAVHSLKDMPVDLPEGLILSAITSREDARDAFVSKKYATFSELPEGAVIGTSSLRRKAQLLNVRPDLRIKDLRGNVDTRLHKLETENLDAIILAAAGLRRLGLSEFITEYLAPEVCLPAVGQGALALESRADDDDTKLLLSVLNDDSSYQQAMAERAFLRQVEGGCQIPVGVQALVNTEGQLVVKAMIAAPEGSKMLKNEITGKLSDADKLGFNLAVKMLEDGGLEILEKLKTQG